ncbi:EAL domain-containing protein [Brenneria izbisi]|uniref:cyclic-guanylate-specific phosphodiesterase n=1 Tax=Brenneria izbisi TaxID=2939450 RepID=A0AA41XZN1_9GAMM|nr:EAL domain-containing protein [Brenneria izbisi]MCV9879806.1 EAL domain-containing protein [Brenneria izbisi]MCV9883195.1 EAL domain-containing protein [Brenneria izbisi]
MKLRKGACQYKGLPLLVAVVLPLLLGLLFTFVESRVMVKRDLESTALISLHHAENISRQAWGMIDHLLRFKGQSCDQIGIKLQRLDATFSYFRSIGVIKDTNIYCSSTFGDVNTSMATLLQYPLPTTRPEKWSMSIANTVNRPGVLFAQMPSTGYGAYVMIDAQYMIDLMLAVGDARGYQITLTVDNGYPIQAGPTIPLESGVFSTSELEMQSEQFPISIRVVAPKTESVRSWKRTFSTFLPMALMLSLFFTATIWYRQKRKLLFRDEIRKGIDKGEFSVYYQPIYDITSQSCIGVEALMRWRRSNGQWIKPDIFIAAAETEGMIIPITRHLFKLVAADVTRWCVTPGFHLGLNVAAEHLQHPDFIADVNAFKETVSSHQLSITLELTERSLISNGPEVIQRLHQLQANGFMIAIDDFGTGHCSLSYLQNFPLDYLKVDRGFISAISSLDEEAPILDAIINLSHRMDLKIFAEGVETLQQLAYLRQRGVVYMQGFLYAKPMDNDSLNVWLHYNGHKPLEALIMKNPPDDQQR